MEGFVRILHVANYNLKKYGKTYYNTDWKLTNGFIRNGHFVYSFSYRDVARSENLLKTTKFGGAKQANAKLIETFKSINPDLLLLGHSEIITPETLIKIRKLKPEIKIALWYVDPLFHENSIQHIIKRLNCLDVVFTTTGGELLKKFKGNTNIATYFPNPIDPSIESNKNYENKNFKVDLLFCGRADSDINRKKILDEMSATIPQLNLEIWGMQGSPLLLGNDYYQKLAETKMGLNLSRRNDVWLYSSDRVAQLTGNGVLTFTPVVPGFNTLYKEDEMVYYENKDELIEKIDFYQNNDEERIKVAKKGWEKAHKSFNVVRVSKYMIETIFDQPYTENYEWINEKI